MNTEIKSVDEEIEKPTPTLLKRVEIIEEKIQKCGKHINTMRDDIDELKEEIFSLTIDVERLQECEKMEQEEKLEENKRYIVHRDVGDVGDLQRYVVSTNGETSTDIRKAKEFTQEEAIKVRNEKNKHFEKCLTQWVISEVK